jgi:uncharacterized membrane protein (UPF0136 family)
MELAQIVLLAYAALMMLGGFAGYKMAKSKPSLISGTASGGVLLVALGWSFGNLQAGTWIGIAVSALLTLVFFLRVKKTKKVMPSGMLLVVSFAALAVLLYAVITTGSGE